jgi:hypothetical protein
MKKGNSMALDRNTLDATIDRYLAGEMTEAERSAFQKMLSQNPEATELLAADSLITNVSAAASAANTGNILPSTNLLQYLSQTRPRRQWTAYFVSAGFAIFLAGILYLQGSNMEVNTVLTRQTTQTQVATPQHNDGQTVTPILVAPAAKNIQSASPASHPLTTASTAQTKKVHHALDEPLSKPKIFTNDSLPIKFHTK